MALYYNKTSGVNLLSNGLIPIKKGLYGKQKARGEEQLPPPVPA